MVTTEGTPAVTGARLIAAALTLATIGYAVVGTALVLMRVIPEGGLTELPEQAELILKAALLLAGIAATAASFVIRRIRDANAPAGDEGIPARTSNLIVAMALVESAGVNGLAVALITGDAMFSMMLWGMAIAGCILHFPTSASFGPRA